MANRSGLNAPKGVGALVVRAETRSGVGGGGFWLLHRARDAHQVMVDGRERAPFAARADMYLDTDGEVIPRASIDGPLAAGIPGTPAALAHIARHYGRLPLDVSLRPAIILARDGFPVDGRYRRMAGFRLNALRASPAVFDGAKLVAAPLAGVPAGWTATCGEKEDVIATLVPH